MGVCIVMSISSSQWCLQLDALNRVEMRLGNFEKAKKLFAIFRRIMSALGTNAVEKSLSVRMMIEMLFPGMYIESE